MTKQIILIVEDEPDIAELIRFHVEREGLAAEVIHSGSIAWKRIQSHPPSLVILDLMLPDIDGLEICRRMRWDEQSRSIPILIVSAKGEESDIVAGLELGADDYLTKPFSHKVLIARLRNLLRRSQQVSDMADMDRKHITAANRRLSINMDRREVKVDGNPVDLTQTEFDMLHYLVKKPGFVRTRDQIISAVRGDTTVLTSRTVDVHVTALRRKLGQLGVIIKTVRGVGYRLDESLAENSQ